jgi:hypothetical protein
MLAPYPFGKPLVFPRTDCISPPWDHIVFSQKEATPVVTISKVITLGVCLAYNLIAHQWGIAFRKPRKYMRFLQHVDIIMSPCHAKKRMPNP